MRNYRVWKRNTMKVESSLSLRAHPVEYVGSSVVRDSTIFLLLYLIIGILRSRSSDLALLAST